MIPDTARVEQIASDKAASAAAYLTRLNPEQARAVETTEGPVLVLAGAGTGKTRVLTTRIAHILLTKKAYPSQILAVTFTNKAAAEMRSRVDELLHSTVPSSEDQPLSHGLWLGTFHSIGAKILRRHAEAVGLTANFTILDDDDQQRLIKQLLNEQHIDPVKTPAKMVLSIIQGWKDRGLTPEKVRSMQENDAFIPARLYPLYQQRLKTLNACDFGDLLLHNLTLFAEHPAIAEEYAKRFRYILVDEYQDTNIAQYLWLRLLALGHRNLCCVGDDDQSIYGWRGAEVGNILKFEQDFASATLIRLERNYRSTSAILKAASGLIAHNQGRLGKTLWTEKDGGNLIRIKSVWDDGEEARFIGEEIEAYQRNGQPLNAMAVLVRTGFQTRAFEERFMTLGIAYRVIGGLRFYERMEIRDAIAYLRIISQPQDDLAFERIINTPKRGIGKTTLEQLHTLARSANQSLYEATVAALSAGRIKGKTAQTLHAVLEQFSAWRTALTEIPLSQVADRMLEESGYRAMWQQDKSPESAGRLENLRELIRALNDFPSLAEFLEHVGLVTDGGKNQSGDMVSIMSLHAAKGLEFPVVFLAGWEEGLFPSQRTLDEKGITGLEEERRLAYVGITRAREHLTISHAANRRMYNQWQSCIPSRFLGEIPKDTIDSDHDTHSLKRANGPALFQKEMEAILAGRIEVAPSATSLPALRKGAQVFHQSFGSGIILNIEGDHLLVAFKHAGNKKILADYVSV
jgi:DNA helicase-2/ATP-dependent DNA helicase PcrA